MTAVTGTNVAAGFKQGGAPYVNNATVPTSVTFAEADGGSDVVLVGISFQDGDGVTQLRPIAFDLYLSDDSGGDGVTGTTASGNVQAGANGTVLGTLTAKKALRCLTKESNGLFTLSITDTANTGFYVCVVNPFTGETHVSTALNSYGA